MVTRKLSFKERQSGQKIMLFSDEFRKGLCCSLWYPCTSQNILCTGEMKLEIITWNACFQWEWNWKDQGCLLPCQLQPAHSLLLSPVQRSHQLRKFCYHCFCYWELPSSHLTQVKINKYLSCSRISSQKWLAQNHTQLWDRGLNMSCWVLHYLIMLSSFL